MRPSSRKGRATLASEAFWNAKAPNLIVAELIRVATIRDFGISTSLTENFETICMAMGSPAVRPALLLSLHYIPVNASRSVLVRELSAPFERSKNVVQMLESSDKLLTTGEK